MKKSELREFILAALCCVIGLLAKRVISPATNILTDFIRMPGGGTSGGIAMAFLLLGATYSRRFWMGTFMGFLQALLSLALGMSGYQGLMSLITFTVPGVIIDVMRFLWRSKVKKNDFFMLTCSAANASAAVVSNFLVFHFAGVTLLLWVGLAASAGLLGGIIAAMMYKRIRFLRGGEN